MEFHSRNDSVSSSIDPFPSKTATTGKNDKRKPKCLKPVELSKWYTANEEIFKKIY